MFVLADGLRAKRFPIGLTVAVIHGRRATGPAHDHAKRPRQPLAKKFIAGDAWDPPAVAPKGSVYFGIGNMYADSAVALEASSEALLDVLLDAGLDQRSAALATRRLGQVGAAI
jgi:hypothetical protein